MKPESELNMITEKIIGAAYKVSNEMGHGFLEKVYENAMIIELKDSGMQTEQQKSLPVFYKTKMVGDYYADLYVENEIIVELKATKMIDEIQSGAIDQLSKGVREKNWSTDKFWKTTDRDKKNGE